MQFYIKRACGHSEWVDVIGPYKDRERKLEYMKNCDCYECQEKRKEAKREEEYQRKVKYYNSKERPEIIRGFYWNKKFYQEETVIYISTFNKMGNLSEGKKVVLNKEQVKELKEYLEKINNKKGEILYDN